MQVTELVERLRANVIDEDLQLYRQIFEETLASDAQDTYWRDALGFFADLTKAQQEVLFRIIRQIGVDTLSTVLGILDGSVSADGIEGEVALYWKGENVSGDLQAIFLSQEQQSEE